MKMKNIGMKHRVQNGAKSFFGNMDILSFIVVDKKEGIYGLKVFEEFVSTLSFFSF